MLVKEIMSKDVVVLSPDDTIDVAAKLMNEKGVGCLPVCKDNNLMGVLTDRDIVIRNVIDNVRPSEIKVEDIMTEDVTVVYPDMNIKEVSEIMAENQIRRVPVVENNQIVGMVALCDVVLHNQSDTEIANTIIDISRK